MNRKIDKMAASIPTIEGAGVNLKRAFGYYEASQLDPFLLLDDFRSDNPDDYLAGFPGILTGALKQLPICWRQGGTRRQYGNKV